jgi:hypothetical protein
MVFELQTLALGPGTGARATFGLRELKAQNFGKSRRM